MAARASDSPVAGLPTCHNAVQSGPRDSSLNGSKTDRLSSTGPTLPTDQDLASNIDYKKLLKAFQSRANLVASAPFTLQHGAGGGSGVFLAIDP
jgi:hypothetical protein